MDTFIDHHTTSLINPLRLVEQQGAYRGVFFVKEIDQHTSHPFAQYLSHTTALCVVFTFLLAMFLYLAHNHRISKIRAEWRWSLLIGPTPPHPAARNGVSHVLKYHHIAWYCIESNEEEGNETSMLIRTRLPTHINDWQHEWSTNKSTPHRFTAHNRFTPRIPTRPRLLSSHQADMACVFSCLIEMYHQHEYKTSPQVFPIPSLRCMISLPPH